MLNNVQIEKLFRTEYSKMIAVLCKKYGLNQIEIAEDIVADTFVLATETWGIKGYPKQPVAWLYGVAKNKVKDFLKRKILFEKKISTELTYASAKNVQIDPDFTSKNVSDSKLQMLFAIVHPSLKQESQIVLALRILCGFSINQIASALLSNTSTINKRLYRAKKQLKDSEKKNVFSETLDLSKRLNSVLFILYLLFSEGYFSKTQDLQLHKDFCLEAMYLTQLLLEEQQTRQPEVYALLALMCFHSSRFEARYIDNAVFLYNQQDRKLWNKDLIRKGEDFLNQSAIGLNVSSYHLEAAIAYWHTEEESEEKWETILQLYNYLLQIQYHPIVTMNRTYSLYKVKGPEVAINEAKKIDLKDSYLYNCLIAIFYEEIDITKAIFYLMKALGLNIPKSDKEIIQERLQQLKN